MINLNREKFTESSTVLRQQKSEKTISKTITYGTNHHSLREKSNIKSEYDEPKYPNDISIDDTHSVLQVKIIYEHINTKCKILDEKTTTGITKSGVLNSGQHLSKGQTLLTSYFQPIRKRNHDRPSEKLESSIEIEDPADLAVSNIAEIDKKRLLCLSKQIRRKYNRLSTGKYMIRLKTVEFLVNFAQKARKQYSAHWNRYRRNKNVSFVYRCLITFQQFAIELAKRRKSETKESSSKMTTEALVTNRRVQKFLNENTSAREMSEEHIIHTVQSDSGAKRLPKNQRTSDNTRLLLLSENGQESSEKDFRKQTDCETVPIQLFTNYSHICFISVFAQRFLDRVEETFINENEHHKYTEFLSILRNFSENQEVRCGADLYLV